LFFLLQIFVNFYEIFISILLWFVKHSAVFIEFFRSIVWFACFGVFILERLCSWRIMRCKWILQVIAKGIIVSLLRLKRNRVLFRFSWILVDNIILWILILLCKRLLFFLFFQTKQIFKLLSIYKFCENSLFKKLLLGEKIMNITFFLEFLLLTWAAISAIVDIAICACLRIICF